MTGNASWISVVCAFVELGTNRYGRQFGIDLLGYTARSPAFSDLIAVELHRLGIAVR